MVGRGCRSDTLNRFVREVRNARASPEAPRDLVPGRCATEADPPRGKPQRSV
jgi:hypothetical protein